MQVETFNVINKCKYVKTNAKYMPKIISYTKKIEFKILKV